MASHGKVIIISSRDHFKQELEQAKAGNKSVVIDFTASWCGPCRTIAPVFAELSEKFHQVVFLKVDVDERADVAKEYNVEAMPTFVFLKDGAEESRVVGADKSGLEATLAKITAPTAPTASTASA